MSTFFNRVKGLFRSKVFVAGTIFGCCAAIAFTILFLYTTSVVPIMVTRQTATGQTVTDRHDIPRYQIGDFVRHYSMMGQVERVRICAFGSIPDGRFAQRRVLAPCKVEYERPD